MARRIRVALVGCGRIARVHRSYLAPLPEAEVVGVWDQDEETRKAFAAESGLQAFASQDELVARARPEVVHILTPPPSHADLACRFLNGGVNVLVEKPLAMNRGEAERVLEAAHESGRWVTVDHNRWFDPVVQQAARLLRDGGLGHLTGVEVFQGAEAARASEAAGDWRLRLPGGVLHNLASHPLYLMRRFAGPAREVHVLACRDEQGGLEEVRLVANGEHAPAVVTMSVRTRPITNRLVLFGSEATVDVNLNNMTLLLRRPRRLPKLLGKVWPNLSEAGQLLAATVRNSLAFATGKQRYYPGIGAHLRNLYTELSAGREPPVSAEEGRDVVAWYDAILAAAGIEPDSDRPREET